MPLYFPQPGASPPLPTKLVLYGTFIDAPVAGELRVRRNTCISIDASGKIGSIVQSVDPDGKDTELAFAAGDNVFVPGFVDCVSFPVDG